MAGGVGELRASGLGYRFFNIGFRAEGFGVLGFWGLGFMLEGLRVRGRGGREQVMQELKDMRCDFKGTLSSLQEP